MFAPCVCYGDDLFGILEYDIFVMRLVFLVHQVDVSLCQKLFADFLVLVHHLTNSVNSAFQSPLQSTPSNCAEQKACLSGLESKKPRLTGRTMQGVLKLPAWIGAAAKCGACINLCTLLLPWQKQGIVLSYWGHLVPAFCRRAHTSHTASKLGHGSLQRFPLKHVAI